MIRTFKHSNIPNIRTFLYGKLHGKGMNVSAADIAAVWPGDGGGDALCGGLLYHRYYISSA